MLLELFIVFFKLGAFTIGGGIAMLPILQNELIKNKKWFTEEEFIDAVAVCQSLPGVIAINMATYVGYKKKGLLGSFIATIGVILPSFIIILIIAKGLASVEDNPYVAGAMAGLRAAALGLILVSVIQLSSAMFKGKWTIIAAALAFVLIGFLNVNTAYVILLFMLLGIASAYVARQRIAAAGAAGGREADRADISADAPDDGKAGDEK